MSFRGLNFLVFDKAPKALPFQPKDQGFVALFTGFKFEFITSLFVGFGNIWIKLKLIMRYYCIYSILLNFIVCFIWSRSFVRIFWWQRTCTSWYGKYPIIFRVSYIPGGDRRISSINSITFIEIAQVFKVQLNEIQVVHLRGFVWFEGPIPFTSSTVGIQVFFFGPWNAHRKKKTPSREKKKQWTS